MKIGLCVGAYFLLSGLVSLVDYFIIKESCLVIKDKSGDIFVGLSMKRGESRVTMTLRRGSQKDEFKVDIDKLFDEEGTLLQTPTLNVFNQNVSAFVKSDKKKD